LADLAVEVDALEHVLQRVHIGVFERFERFVERRPDVGLQMANLRPVGFLRHKEGVLVRIGQLRRNETVGHALSSQVFAKLLAFLIEQIAQRFRNSMPKMYSLYSDASMLPRRSSHARNNRLES